MCVCPVAVSPVSTRRPRACGVRIGFGLRRRCHMLCCPRALPPLRDVRVWLTSHASRPRPPRGLKESMERGIGTRSSLPHVRAGQLAMLGFRFAPKVRRSKGARRARTAVRPECTYLNGASFSLARTSCHRESPLKLSPAGLGTRPLPSPRAIANTDRGRTRHPAVLAPRRSCGLSRAFCASQSPSRRTGARWGRDGRPVVANLTHPHPCASCGLP